MAELPELVDDRIFFPVLQRLQECLCEELAKAGGPALCYCGVMVGDIMPLDLMSCSESACGVAWVRPMQQFPSLEFPTPAENAECTAPLAMPVEIGVARCYPRRDPRQPLDPQLMFEALRLYMSDSAAVRRAVKCCLNDASYMGSYAMGTWEPIEAQNGISGGTWVVTLRPEV